jgi:hypothetical protein
MNDAKEQKTDSHIALLAPVPLVHLKSAGDVKERVEFGSLAFGVFDTLEKQRASIMWMCISTRPYMMAQASLSTGARRTSAYQSTKPKNIDHLLQNVKLDGAYFGK